ncbi:MAG: TPR repeat protein [Sulfurimonas sp.]|jgi:TPR repeat protein|uniref:tetratricopeptide repeat protein n=1 Tax=Sulfurimonas sp. TaxID=2022749 RepID=UPI0039E5E0F5
MSKIIIFITILLSVQTLSYAHSAHSKLVYGGPDLALEVSTQYQSPVNQKFKEDCNNGKKQACVRIGTLYYTGQDKEIKINVKKAQRFFNKACNKKSATGCYYLAVTHLRGGKGVKKSDKKAMYDFARGCHLGNMSSCDQYRKLEEG